MMVFCLGKMALKAAVVFLFCTEVSISFPVQRILTPVYYYNYYGFMPAFYIPVFPHPPKPQKTINPTITPRPKESTTNNPAITPRPKESTNNPAITPRPKESTNNPAITLRPKEGCMHPPCTSGKCDHQPAAAPIFIFPSSSGKETRVFQLPSITGGHAGSNYSGHSVFVFPDEDDQDTAEGGGVPFFVYPNEVADTIDISRSNEETSADGSRGDAIAGGNHGESIPPSMVVLPGVLVRVPEGGE